MGIIGVILSILVVLLFLFVMNLFGWDALNDPDLLKERIEEMQQNQ